MSEKFTPPKSWAKKGKEVNLTYGKALKFIRYLREKHEGYVSFDTETEDLGYKYNRLVSVQFSIDENTGYVILLDKPFLEMPPQKVKKIKNKLRRLFEDPDTKITWVMHNSQFDMAQSMSQLGVTYIPRPVLDTMLLIHLLDENRIKLRIPNALKSVCEEFFGFTLYSKEAIDARGAGNLLLLSKEKFIEYAGMDGYVTFRLMLYLQGIAKQKKYWNKLENLGIHLLSEAAKMFTRVSTNGIYVDKEQLMHLLSKESPILKRLKDIKDIYRAHPKVIAVNNELYKQHSGGQKSTFGLKAPWIFDMNKTEHRVALFFKSKKGFCFSKNDSGKYSTDKGFQKKYGNEELVKLFTEEQGLKKLKTSYLDPIWRSLVSGKDTKDGRVRAKFNLNGTVTGRVSSRDPNLQQIPRSDNFVKKQIKSLYAAEPSGNPDDPNVLLQCDFAANEVRFWAAISNDPYLCQLFTKAFKLGEKFRENPTNKELEEEAKLLADIHKQTASLMFDVPIKEVTKALRQDSKGLSLGIMYCRGIHAVAQQLGCTFEEAEAKFKKFFAKFGRGVQWSDEMKALVLKQGYVESPLGRRRRLRDLIKKGEEYLARAKKEPRGSKKGKFYWKTGNGLIARAQRQAVNSPIQGLASDLALMSCFLLDRYIVRKNKKWKIVNSVHDSMLMEIRASEVMEASKIIRKIFTYMSKDYAKEYFGWEMPTNIDIDFELSQGKAKKCKKCGTVYAYHEKSCSNKKKNEKGEEVKCGCSDWAEYKLNHGYGTLLPFAEHLEDFAKIRKGF